MMHNLTGLPRRTLLTGTALLGAVGLSGCGVVDFSPEDDSLLAVGTRSGPVQLWNTASGTQVGEFTADGVGHDQVRFLPNQEIVVSYRHTAVVSRLSSTAGELSTVTVPGSSVIGFDVSSSGHAVIAGQPSGEVWIWDLTGSAVQLPPAPGEITAITWVAETGRVVAVSQKKGLIAFDGKEWTIADLP